MRIDKIVITGKTTCIFCVYTWTERFFRNCLCGQDFFLNETVFINTRVREDVALSNRKTNHLHV